MRPCRAPQSHETSLRSQRWGRAPGGFSPTRALTAASPRVGKRTLSCSRAGASTFGPAAASATNFASDAGSFGRGAAAAGVYQGLSRRSLQSLLKSRSSPMWNAKRSEGARRTCSKDCDCRESESELAAALTLESRDAMISDASGKLRFIAATLRDRSRLGAREHAPLAVRADFTRPLRASSPSASERTTSFAA